MKKAIGMLCVLAMLLSVMAVSGISVGASTRTQAEAATWINAKVGQYLDYDKAYGAQCVDLIYYYYNYLGEDARGGNACDYASNSLPSGWQRFRYASGFVAQPGDIAVYTRTLVNGVWQTYGHVALVASATASNMVVVEQNYGGVARGSKRTAAYNESWMELWGFIRPSFSDTAAPPINYTTITGDYYLQNRYTGEYMSVGESKDANEQNVNVWPFTGESGMKMAISSDSIGQVIRPHCTASRVVNGGAVTPVDGTNVNIYNNVNDATQRWGFESAGDGYYIIHLLSNPNLVITQDHQSRNIRVETYRESYYQLWKLESVAEKDNPPDTQAPIISNVQVVRVTDTMYRISCTVSDNVGIAHVLFPTWTYTDGQNDAQAQDDLVWHGATINGNTATCDIYISDHNNETGHYCTDVYAYDEAGNKSFGGRWGITMEEFTENEPTTTTGPILTTQTKPSGDASLLGDLSGDGAIDMRDAFSLYTAASGGSELTAAQKAAADMNGDGAIDMRDAFALYKIASGG